MIITASMLTTYKKCRRRFFFEYIENLRPSVTPEALEIGTNYHEQLSMVLSGGKPDVSTLPGIMADAFNRFLPWKDWGITETEKEFIVPIGGGHELAGKIDAIAEGGLVVEHKTTGYAIDEKYMRKLELDDQINCYLLATNTDRVLYTVCQKPTIRKDVLERARDWYDDTKVQAFTVHRNEQEIRDFQQELVAICNEIEGCLLYYKNPSACTLVPCSYRDICLDYDPECFMGYVKKERRHEELCIDL